jgi:hypothetical protein
VGAPNEVRAIFSNDIMMAREIDKLLFGKHKITSIKTLPVVSLL